MVREHGFEGMLATYRDTVQESQAALKQKREDRRTNRVEKVDTTKDSDLFNLFVDFNLDGTMTYGDSGLKSALQLQSLFKDLTAGKPDQEAKIIDNILAVVNGSATEKIITRENATELANLNAIQNVLKNPPVDARYLLKYGADATKKFIEDNQASAAETLAEKKALDEKAAQEAENIKADVQKQKNNPEVQSDPEAMAALEELEKMPMHQLREGLREVLEAQVMSWKAS